MYCASAETVISELPVKIMISSLDLATRVNKRQQQFGDQATFSDKKCAMFPFPVYST